MDGQYNQFLQHLITNRNEKNCKRRASMVCLQCAASDRVGQKSKSPWGYTFLRSSDRFGLRYGTAQEHVVRCGSPAPQARNQDGDNASEPAYPEYDVET